MLSDTLTAVAAPAILGAALWVAPSPAFNAGATPFGVRVPPDRVDAPVVGRQRRRYRTVIVTTTIAAIIVSIALVLTVDAALGVAIAFFAPLAAAGPGWWLAHRSIAATKQREGWYHGLRQGTVADTSLRTDPVRFPRAWAVPPVITLVGTTIAGVLAYPRLPQQLWISHASPQGTVYRPVATTIWTAFLPVFGQLLTTAMFVALVALLLRTRGNLDVSRPAASAGRYRRYLELMVRSALAANLLVNLMMLGLAALMWSGDRSITRLLLVTGAPMLVTIAGIVYLAIWVRAAGRLAGTDPVERTGLVTSDDDRYWHLAGLVYANRNDPALLVPKRVGTGIGWTVNVAHLAAQIIMAAIVMAAVTTAVIGALAAG